MLLSLSWGGVTGEKQQDAERSSRGERGVTWGVSGVEWGGMPSGGGWSAESTGRGPQRQRSDDRP